MAALSKAAERQLLTKIDFAPALQSVFEWVLDGIKRVLRAIGRAIVGALTAGVIVPGASTMAAVDRTVSARVHRQRSAMLEAHREGARRAITAGREAAVREQTLDVASEDTPAETVRGFERWADEATDSTLDTLSEDVADVVRGAFETGQSPDEAAAAVRSAFEARFTGWKADQLARTLVTSAGNAGRHSAHRDAPAILGERWFSMQDEDVRHSHRIADGQIVAVGTPFVVGTPEHEARYPGDPTLPLSEWINCRCRSLPRRRDSFTAEQIATLQSGERLNA